MTYEEKLDEIFSKIKAEPVLEQLIEESGELVQVTAKQLRIMRRVNPTPITSDENVKKKLEEEIADVQICIDLAILAMRCDKAKTQENVEVIKQHKLSRWLDRLGIKAE